MGRHELTAIELGSVIRRREEQVEDRLKLAAKELSHSERDEHFWTADHL